MTDALFFEDFTVGRPDLETIFHAYYRPEERSS